MLMLFRLAVSRSFKKLGCGHTWSKVPGFRGPSPPTYDKVLRVSCPRPTEAMGPNGLWASPTLRAQNTDGCSLDQSPAPEQATHEHQELSRDHLSPPTSTTTTTGGASIAVAT